MDPFTMMAIMAALGVAKGELFDRPAAEHQRDVEATKERWSPFTGQHGGYVQQPNIGNNVFQGAMSGYGISEQMAQAENMKKYMDILEAQKTGGGAYGGFPAAQAAMVGAPVDYGKLPGASGPFGGIQNMPIGGP